MVAQQSNNQFYGLCQDKSIAPGRAAQVISARRAADPRGFRGGWKAVGRTSKRRTPVETTGRTSGVDR